MLHFGTLYSHIDAHYFPSVISQVILQLAGGRSTRIYLRLCVCLSGYVNECLALFCGVCASLQLSQTIDMQAITNVSILYEGMC